MKTIGEKGLKVGLWIFSVLYVAIPGIVAWYIWTGDMTFREGLEDKGKLYMTGLCILLAIVANFVAWTAYHKHRKLFGGKKNEPK